MNIQLIRNATVIISYGGKRFLLDPMFASKNTYEPIKNSINSDLKWPTAELPFSPKEIIRDLDVTIMTRYDTAHFDEAAINTLRKGVKVYIQNETEKETLRKLGFSNLTVLQEEGTSFAGARLFKTICDSKRISDGLNINEFSMGVVFKHPEEPTIYIPGDTIFENKIKSAINIHNPHYIVLNCSGSQINGQKINMDLEDIKALHHYAPNTKIIAIGLDTMGNAAIGRKELAKYAKDNKFANSIIIPKDGEIIKL